MTAEEKPRRRVWWPLIIVGLLGIAAAIVLFIFREPVLLQARAWIDATIEYLRLAPAWVFFAALSILPAVGFPVAPMLIVAGPVYGAVYGISLSSLALAVNMTFCYWLARFFGGRVRPWLEKLGYRVPQAPRREEMRLTLLLRLCGIPLFIQNYVLGLSGVRYPVYMLVSWPVLTLQTIGFVLLGDALFDGQVGGIILAVVVIVVVVLLFRMGRSYYGQAAVVRKPDPAE